jgi:hypothetical protein
MTKRERIQTIHDSLCNYQLSFGTNDAYRLIIDAFTEMLLVLAEEPDYDEIAKRMVKVFLDQPLPGPMGVKHDAG